MALGYKNLILGNYAVAEGKNCSALFDMSHAEGQFTKTSEVGQHVEGRYNNPITGYQKVVGGGTSDSDRTNIYTLDWNGNGNYLGNVNANSFTISGNQINQSNGLVQLDANGKIPSGLYQASSGEYNKIQSITINGNIVPITNKNASLTNIALTGWVSQNFTNKIQSIKVNGATISIVNKTASLTNIALTGWVSQNFASKTEIIQNGIINVKNYGAVGDGVHDDTASFKSAIEAASYKTLFIPGGNYLVSSLVINQPMRIAGVEKNASNLRAITSDVNIFNINLPNTFPILIQNVGFSPKPNTEGGYIIMDEGTSFITVQNQNDSINNDSIIRNCMFISGNVAVNCVNTAFFKIEDCRFQSNKKSVYIHATVSGAQDAGDSTINGCFFGNPDVNSQSVGILQEACGGLRVINNKFIGQTYSYLGKFNTPGRKAAGQPNGTSILIIEGNSFEMFEKSAIAIQPYSSNNRTPLASVVINGNQISFYNKSGESNIHKYGITVQNGQDGVGSSGSLTDYLLIGAIISNNQITYSLTDPNYTHGIYLQSTINSVIERNIFNPLNANIIDIGIDCYNIDVYHQGYGFNNGIISDSADYMVLSGQYIHKYNFPN